MNLLTKIESACRELSDHRAKLRKKFEARQKAVALAVAGFDSEIRELQTQCLLSRTAIELNLSVGRELFLKRKTLTFFGITVGFKKAQDTLNLPDDAILVDRIEKLLPAKQAETVLDRSVAIIKTAFKKLPWEILQKLGCSKTQGADSPVSSPMMTTSKPSSKNPSVIMARASRPQIHRRSDYDQ